MILRLILGDQCNYHHSWYRQTDKEVLYLIMEMRQETDYVKHHIQKVTAFFLCMEQFAEHLKKKGHKVMLLKLNDTDNLHDLQKNIERAVKRFKISKFEYMYPDEYRLDEQLNTICTKLNIPFEAFDTEHFYTKRDEVKHFFEGKKQVVMENFYRHMRKKHGLLMAKDKPEGNRWNFDMENRKPIPEGMTPPRPLLFSRNATAVVKRIRESGVKTFGNINEKDFTWPVNRDDSLNLLKYFCDELLQYYGTYQDAMTDKSWSLFHSRLSFSLNTKMLSPAEVIEKVIDAGKKQQVDLSQIEGFVRQILGWREFLRGIYWWKMPGYRRCNFFRHQRKLPGYFWTAKTKMNCMHHAIKNSLDHAWAHHIQRLMVTGNFALLAGIHPNDVDAWYLGIYADAIEWVEITNTRGMSQYADGGLIATKPYVSSASYINKMSNYCKDCHYAKSKKTGEKACPFNSLYWNFIDTNKEKFTDNRRMKMMLATWNKMQAEKKSDLLEQAEKYLNNLEDL